MCGDCDVPGYLVLCSRRPATSLTDLTGDGREELGVTLDLLERAVSSIIKPDRIYMLRFSEALDTLHFHIFPRTAELGARFALENAGDELALNGPAVFMWARRTFAVADGAKLSRQTIETGEEIRRWIAAQRLVDQPGSATIGGHRAGRPA